MFAPPARIFRIAIIVFDIRTTGGIEAISYQLARALRERGHSVFIFNIANPNAPINQEDGTHKNLNDIPICHLKTKGGIPYAASQASLKSDMLRLFIKRILRFFLPSVGFLLREKYINLTEMLQQYKIDIIIDNHWKCLPLPFIPPSCRLFKVVHQNYETAVQINVFHKMKQRLKSYEHLILLTRAEENHWQKLHPQPICIPNFIAPIPHKASLDAKRIITVCRIESQKALHRLILIFWAIIKTKEEKQSVPFPFSLRLLHMIAGGGAKKKFNGNNSNPINLLIPPIASINGNYT